MGFSTIVRRIEGGPIVWTRIRSSLDSVAEAPVSGIDPLPFVVSRRGQLFFGESPDLIRLADLFVQFVLLGVGPLAHLLAAVAKDVGWTGQRLLLPAPSWVDVRQTSARSEPPSCAP